MYPAKPNNTKQKVAAGVLTLLAAAVVTGSVHTYDRKQHAANATVTGPAASTGAVAPPAQAATTRCSAGSSHNGYKDGTYSASSDYFVPSGNESIKVTLTLKNGIVTNSQLANSENDRESVYYQEEFARQYKNQVVGKSISGIHLSYVAGASDTTQAFTDALNRIMNQAQA